MKIVHINKSDTIGGASVAAMRLVKSQRKMGLDSSLLVQEAQIKKDFITHTSHNSIKRKLNLYRLALEKLLFLPHETSPELRFAFSTANTGENIQKHPLIKQADILHLHWFNQGYLSINSLKKLARLNKPIVWTLHDMWAFTGGCHYAGKCNLFMDECSNCPYIKRRRENDLSNTIFYRKKRLYQKGKWHFVAPSQWMKNLADQSTLIRQFKVENIPNAIDTGIFKPAEKKQIRQELKLPTDRKIILFGAMNTSDRRKGMQYLMNALKILAKKSINSKIALAVFGKSTVSFLKELPFTTYDLGLINNETEMARIYQAADIFVIPSLEDNLPNTVVEAQASALPVVAFDTAGLSEMIHHEEDGYLANFLSVEDLAAGIYWSLFEADYQRLSHNSRINAEINYEEKDVALKHLQYYEDILKEKYKRLEEF